MKKLILSVVLSLMTSCFAATIYLPHPKMNSNGSMALGWFWKKYEVKNYRIENGVIDFTLNGKRYRSTVFMVEE
ncbi:MAG: hypothetical protein J6S85_19910 [Methanobrevibacter sp.]|nr:hypothetical protein [Methanobrevibacter sp.]